MAPRALYRLIALQLLFSSPAALGMQAFKGTAGTDNKLGVTNKFGVTRYNSKKIQAVRSSSGFYWPDSTSRSSSEFAGAMDLTDNVSWGWHHPNGMYNTIPVGAPLFDADMNIYLASDDAVRKFSPGGDLVWSYAPRGQIASAPALWQGTAQRRAGGSTEAEDPTLSFEEALRPSKDSTQSFEDALRPQELAFFKEVRAGDRLAVLPGKGYHANGKEYFKAGDHGEIRDIVADEKGVEQAIIQWPRTGFESTVALASLPTRFARIKASPKKVAASLLVGSTTSGYVFAINLENGMEVWATEVSKEISGVKGSVGIKDGIVLVATDRCVDRYCYRYRNQTNPLSPSNTFVRALSIEDGSEVWKFRPYSPVWNFVPQFRKNDTVLFSDMEGSVYCLNLQTGEKKWRLEGAIGTYTQANAVYDEGHDMVFGMGETWYENKYCNPYPSPGVLPSCGSYQQNRVDAQYKPGWVKGISASSGNEKWHLELDEVPASATVGKMPGFIDRKSSMITRLVVAVGKNCEFNSPTKLFAVEPHNGHIRWWREGPTLWTTECAGDFEGGDIRRAMGSRSICQPNSWSAPVIDSEGAVYIGNQVGQLQKWASPTGATREWALASTLNTGVAFQDQSISMAQGVMAVATCNALIVMQTGDMEKYAKATVDDGDLSLHTYEPTAAPTSAPSAAPTNLTV